MGTTKRSVNTRICEHTRVGLSTDLSTKIEMSVLKDGYQTHTSVTANVLLLGK